MTRSSKTPTTPATKVAVILRSTTRPGLKRCGDYDLDRTHQVDVAEARRLVDAKGFEFVTPGDEAACNEALKAAEAAAAAKTDTPTNTEA